MNYKNFVFFCIFAVVWQSNYIQAYLMQPLPLHEIIKSQNSVEQKKQALQHELAQGVTINMQDPSGKTVLNLALFLNQDPALVQFLIQDCQADVNIPDRFNVSPLHNAIKKFEISNIIMLLQAGAKIDEPKDDADQQSPLDLAARSPEIMSLFQNMPVTGA
jgi:ankyrin repeat protein